MKANEVRHQSAVANDHKIIASVVAWIHAQGDKGMKSGILFLKSGVSLSKWYSIQAIVRDMEDIEYFKDNHTYYSMRGQDKLVTE